MCVQVPPLSPSIGPRQNTILRMLPWCILVDAGCVYGGDDYIDTANGNNDDESPQTLDTPLTPQSHPRHRSISPSLNLHVGSASGLSGRARSLFTPPTLPPIRYPSSGGRYPSPRRHIPLLATLYPTTLTCSNRHIPATLTLDHMVISHPQPRPQSGLILSMPELLFPRKLSLTHRGHWR